MPHGGSAGAAAAHHHHHAMRKQEQHSETPTPRSRQSHSRNTVHPDDQTPTVLPPRSEWLLSGEMNKLAARDMGPSDHGASFKKTRGLTRFVVLADHSLFFSMHFDEFSVFCSSTLDGIKTKEGDSLATEKALRAQFKKIDTDQTGSISREELKGWMLDNNLYTSENAFNRLFEKFDADGSCEVDYEEFKLGMKEAAVSVKVVECIPMKELVQVNAEDNILRISTDRNGEFRGRVFAYALSCDECQLWLDTLLDALKKEEKRAAEEEFRLLYDESKFKMLRAMTKAMHTSNGFAYILAVVILVAFVGDIIEAQIQPAAASYEAKLLNILDFCVTGFFALELLINLFANSNDSFKPFYTDASNWLDVFVVLVSVVNLILVYSSDVEMPNAKLLRMLRIGRIVRLFKTLQGLQRLVDACTAAWWPVVNTFTLLLIISAVFAILATSLFGEQNPVFFGNFQVSFYTMFEILLGNMGIAREINTGQSNAGDDKDDVAPGADALGADPLVALFFIFYMLIGCIMMLNVVVAVLCEEFMEQMTRAQQAEEKAILDEQDQHKLKGCLDPMNQMLITFKDEADLIRKIDELYDALDSDGNGGLDYAEFRQRAMELIPTIAITRDDFEVITEKGTHIGPTGEFNRTQFLDMMRGELWRYSGRQLDNVLEISGDEHFRATILMQKLMQADFKAEFRELRSRLPAASPLPSAMLSSTESSVQPPTSHYSSAAVLDADPPALDVAAPLAFGSQTQPPSTPHPPPSPASKEGRMKLRRARRAGTLPPLVEGQVPPLGVPSANLGELKQLLQQMKSEIQQEICGKMQQEMQLLRQEMHGLLLDRHG